MNTQDTLMAYSEWLDGEKKLMRDEELATTHEDLVKEFLDYWADVPDRAPLAGREALLGYATTEQLINELQARASVAATIGEDWPQYSTMGGE